MSKKSWSWPVKGLIMSALASGAIALGGPAQASHYRLPVSNMVTTQEADALAKAGVATTLALLQEVGTADKRKALAQKSGIPVDRLEALAHQVDLIRFDGIGPSMVKLLQASGIQNSRALASADATSLHAQIVAANDANKIAPVVPQPGLVAEWVAAAKRLPQVVTGL